MGGHFAAFAIFVTGEMTADAVASADTAEAQDIPSSYFFSQASQPPGIGFCSAWPGSHWGNLVIRLSLAEGQALQVNRGDVIEVEATTDLTPFWPTYTLSATLKRQRAQEVEPMSILKGTLMQNPLKNNKWELSN